MTLCACPCGTVSHELDVLATKPCLRCKKSLPVDQFAFGGRCTVCDTCRWDHPMTAEERRLSNSLRKAASKRRHIHEVRERDREYQRRRAA